MRRLPVWLTSRPPVLKLLHVNEPLGYSFSGHGPRLMQITETPYRVVMTPLSRQERLTESEDCHENLSSQCLDFLVSNPCVESVRSYTIETKQSTYRVIEIMLGSKILLKETWERAFWHAVNPIQVILSQVVLYCDCWRNESARYLDNMQIPRRITSISNSDQQKMALSQQQSFNTENPIPSRYNLWRIGCLLHWLNLNNCLVEATELSTFLNGCRTLRLKGSPTKDKGISKAGLKFISGRSLKQNEAFNAEEDEYIVTSSRAIKQSTEPALVEAANPSSLVAAGYEQQVLMMLQQLLGRPSFPTNVTVSGNASVHMGDFINQYIGSR